MRKEQINPGYVNQIFEFSDAEPSVNRTEFINGKIVKKEIGFFYEELQFIGDYIKLTVNVDYRLIEERGNTILPVKNRYSFRIVNGNGITAEELFVILENCIQRINIFLKDLNPTLQNVPNPLPKPLWEGNYKDLEKIAQSIEDYYNNFNLEKRKK